MGQKERKTFLEVFDSIDIESNRNVAIKMPIWMGATDIPWELLDKMPKEEDGTIVLDIEHPEVQKFIAEEDERIKKFLIGESISTRPLV